MAEHPNKHIREAIRSAIAGIGRAGYTVDRVESADQSIFSRINQELAKQ